MKGFVRTGVVTAAGLVAAAGMARGASAQVDSFWLAAVDGDWNDPTRWSSDPLFPNNGNGGFNFNAFINVSGAAYTVTLNQGITIDGFEMTSPDATLDLTNFQLTMLGAYLQESSRVRTAGGGATGSLRFAAGGGGAVFRGATVENVASILSESTLSFEGAAGNDISATTIDHTGTAVAWQDAGDIRLGGGVLFMHGSASVFTISNDRAMVWDAMGPRPVLENRGALVKAAGAGVTFLDGVTLDNMGTVEVQAGTLRANNVANVAGGALTGGTWIVSGPSTLDFVGETITANRADVTLDGPGSAFPAIDGLSLNDNGAMFTVAGGREFAAAGSFTNLGTLRVGAGSEFRVGAAGTLTAEGGTIEGPGALRTLGEFTIRGTTFQGASVFSMGLLTFEGAAATDVCDSDIDHHGPRCNWVSGDIMMASGSTFTNGQESEFTITAAASMFWDNSGARPSLVNDGTMVRTADAGMTDIAGVSLSSTGTVRVEAGTLRADTVQNVAGGVLTGGAWEVMDAATLDFAGQTITTNAADVTLSGATSTFADFTGSVAVNDAAGSLSVTEGREFTTAGGFTNDGDVKVEAATDPALFKIASGFTLTNFDAGTGTLTGGSFEVIGPGRASATVEIDGLDIRTLEAAVMLRGAGASILDPTAGMDQDAVRNLETIADAGMFEIAEGKDFIRATSGFTVAPAGTLNVGDSSLFSVTTIANFAGGVFADGVFNVGGVIRADNAMFTTLDSTVLLDGPGRHFERPDGMGGFVDAFTSLDTMTARSRLTLARGYNLELDGGLSQAAGSLLQIGPVAATDDTSLHVRGDFTQDGTLRLLGGVLIVDGVHFANGPIEGSGTIQIGPRGESRFVSHSDISVGDDGSREGAIGRLTIIGIFFHADDASVTVQIGGLEPGTGYDQLDVRGLLIFDQGPGGGRAGLFRVEVMPDFAPEPGQAFDVILYEGRDGFFREHEGLDLGGGLRFEVEFLDDRMRLVVVPGPGAAWVALAGAVFMTRRKRR